jgi:hypothetical protein
MLWLGLVKYCQFRSVWFEVISIVNKRTTRSECPPPAPKVFTPPPGGGAARFGNHWLNTLFRIWIYSRHHVVGHHFDDISFIALVSKLTAVGTRLHTSSWFGHYTTSRKIAGSISNEIIRFFICPNPSRSTLALGSTRPLTEMSTRNVLEE